MPKRKTYLSHIILLLHQHVLIIFQFQIAIIVAEKILSAFLSFINVCKIMKVETLLGECNSINRFLSVWIQSSQNSSVFTENRVYFSDSRIGIFILPVVERISAIIRTKNFVFSTGDFNSTFGARSFFHSLDADKINKN